jgi:enoyl-CoA hydratase/carnithine racemase
MFEYLRVTDDPSGATRVVMDRPPANALNDQLIDELTRMAKHLAETDHRVVLLTSAAPMFQAGADLVGTVNVDWDAMHARIGWFQAATNAWEAIPVPTIALINGHALGGGCEMALACDFRIMARGKGRIGLPEVRRGLLAAGGGTQRTARLLGRHVALDLSLRGRMLDADEAARIGLVNEACDADQLEVRAQALADELLALPRPALIAIKRCVIGGSDTDLAAGLAIEREQMTALGQTADAHEGVKAFVEKREPVWTHR